MKCEEILNWYFNLYSETHALMIAFYTVNEFLSFIFVKKRNFDPYAKPNMNGNHIMPSVQEINVHPHQKTVKDDGEISFDEDYEECTIDFKYDINCFTFAKWNLALDVENMYEDFFSKQRSDLDLEVKNKLYTLPALFPLFINTNLKIVAHFILTGEDNKFKKQIMDGSLFEKMIEEPRLFLKYIEARKNCFKGSKNEITGVESK